jgi:hypothetical protein
MDAIKAGNFISWQGLTTLVVQKQFPDSNEIQKGHMKKQCQGVRSTKLKENTQSKNENIPGNTVAEVDPSPPKKMRDIFIKKYREVMAKDMHRGCLLLRISPPYCIIPTVTFTM